MRTKRILSALLLAAAASSVLAGCGDSDARTDEPLSDIAQAVMDCGTEFPEMVEVNEDNFIYEYGLEAGDYEEYSVYWAGSGGDADEICIIKANDTGKVKKAVKERLDRRKDDFEDYVEEEYEKLCDSKVKTKGSYIYWLCTNDNSRSEKELLSHFSE
ncbi:MAG: DUF4358 domain-containing protein [Porcipelethomonas sp.]